MSLDPTRGRYATKSSDSWTGVGGWIWRHTLGRGSNLIRIPFALILGIFQIGKMVSKVVVLPVTYTVIGIHYLITKKNYHGSMSLIGIAIDGIGLLKVAQVTAKCFIRVIVAPSRNSTSFEKDVEVLCIVIADDELQLDHEKHPELYTIQRIFNKVFSRHRKGEIYD